MSRLESVDRWRVAQQRTSVLVLGAVMAMIAGCNKRSTASQPEQLDDCYRRFVSYRNGDALTCANPAPVLGPTVAGPGRVRTIFDWPVFGVPQVRAQDGFSVLDLTPAGQTFVASGTCPGSLPAAMSWDAHHDFHVICAGVESSGEAGAGMGRALLHDLSLVGDRFVEQRRPLALEPGPPLAMESLIVAYPDHDEPLVFYAHVGDDPLSKLPPDGPVQVRRWVDSARAFVPHVTLGGHAEVAAPLAVIVQSGVVRFVARFNGTQDGRVQQFRLVEPGTAAALDRGELAVDPVPAEYSLEGEATRFDATDGDHARLDLVVATVSEAATQGLIRVDDARAVPGPNATNARWCPGDLPCGRSAIAGGEHGCVCTTKIFTHLGDDALGIQRSRADAMRP